MKFIYFISVRKDPKLVQIKETKNCPIRVEPLRYQPSYVTQCGHAFQSAALLQWLHVAPVSNCPSCREKLDPVDTLAAALDIVRNPEAPNKSKEVALEMLAEYYSVLDETNKIITNADIIPDLTTAFRDPETSARAQYSVLETLANLSESQVNQQRIGDAGFIPDLVTIIKDSEIQVWLKKDPSVPLPRVAILILFHLTEFPANQQIMIDAGAISVLNNIIDHPEIPDDAKKEARKILLTTNANIISDLTTAFRDPETSPRAQYSVLETLAGLSGSQVNQQRIGDAGFIPDLVTTIKDSEIQVWLEEDPFIPLPRVALFILKDLTEFPANQHIIAEAGAIPILNDIIDHPAIPNKHKREARKILAHLNIQEDSH